MIMKIHLETNKGEKFNFQVRDLNYNDASSYFLKSLCSEPEYGFFKASNIDLIHNFLLRALGHNQHGRKI